MKKIRLFLMLSVILILSLAMAVPALASDPSCVPHATFEPVSFDTGLYAKSCLGWHLSPATLVADFYLVFPDNPVDSQEYLMDTQSFEGGTGYLIQQGFDAGNSSPNVIAARNIKEPGNPDFGVLYTYADTSVNFKWPPPGITKELTITPKKTYIRGTLELTCDIKNHAGEAVSCGVTIDGAAPASNASLTPGQKANYVLDPGAHTVTVTLAGANATLWAPATFSKPVNIKASATVTKLKAEFKKAGHLLVSLDQPGIVGDWYLDGVQVGTQVATLDQWVTPGGSHKVEVKNLTDPKYGAGHWADASKSLSVASGKEKSEVLKLKGAVADVSGFVGTWSGTANTSSGRTFDITITIKEPCTFGGICGTFKITAFNCSGKVMLLNITGNLFEWGAVQGCGQSATPNPLSKDTLTLNPDGTLHYRFDDLSTGSWSDGILTKK